MAQRTAIVTGGYGTIGREIVRGLAQADVDVTIVGRDQQAGRTAAQELTRETGRQVDFAQADLSRRRSIDELRLSWQNPLHILVNNAGTTPRHRKETPEGLEVQFATNVLGYVWMTLAFEDLLVSADSARVVNVASYWAGDLDLHDLQFRTRRYDNDTAYRQSKQANRLLTVVLAERFHDRGVTVNACHPGDTPSKLARNLGFGGSQTPEQCAETPVYLALDKAVAEVTGKWFSSCAQQPDHFVDTTMPGALWARIKSFVEAT